MTDLPTADRAARAEAMHKAIDSRGSYEIEFRVLLPDGTMRWMAGRVRCISDGPGRPVRVLGVLADITQRKVAEKEARDRREQVDLLGRLLAGRLLLCAAGADADDGECEGGDRDGSADDPRLALIMVEAQSVEYLVVNQPRPVVLFEVVKGMVTGKKPNLGEQRSLTDRELDTPTAHEAR